MRPTSAGPSVFSRLALPSSVVSSVDKVCRLRSVVNSRLDGLRKQYVHVLGAPDCLRSVVDQEFLSLQAILIRLDNNSFICNDEYRRCFLLWSKFPRKLEDHCIALFGSYRKPEIDNEARLRAAQMALRRALEAGSSVDFIKVLRERVEEELFLLEKISDLVEKMKLASIVGRRSEVLSRLSLEIQDRVNDGWYFIFNTLTVSPEFMEKVFPEVQGDRSTAWTDYIRFCDRYFGISSHGSVAAARVSRAAGDEFHTYFAVVERGAQSGRLHIHVLHIVKDLPSSFADPNYGVAVPKRREIVAMKSFWKYGYSVPVAVRFSAEDSFGRKGWRWPVTEMDGIIAPLTAKPFDAIVNYIGKYLTKDVVDQKFGVKIWRVRLSRNLGSRKLKALLDQLPLKSRIQLLKNPRLNQYYQSVKIPRQMTKRLIMKSFRPRTLRGVYRRALESPQRNIFAQYRALMKGILVPNRLSFGSTKILNMRMRDASNVFRSTRSQASLAGATYAA